MARLKSSLIISLIINIVLMIINYIYYLNNKHLLFGFKMYGGECLNENGFGLNVFHTYAMRPGQSDTVKINFTLTGFIVFLLLTTLIIYLIQLIIYKLKK